MYSIYEMAKLASGSRTEPFRMKTVGRRAERLVTLDEARQLLRTAAELRPVDRLVPRGVYRFESFEEADRWLRETMARTLVRHSSKISSGSAAR